MCVEADGHSTHPPSILGLGTGQHEQEKDVPSGPGSGALLPPCIQGGWPGDPEILHDSMLPSSLPWLLEAPCRGSMAVPQPRALQGLFIPSPLPAQLTQTDRASGNARLSVWIWSPQDSRGLCAAVCSPGVCRGEGHCHSSASDNQRKGLIDGWDAP